MKKATKILVWTICVVIILSILSITASAEDYSTNDTMETASTLNPNSTVYDNIDDQNDIDYYKITLTSEGKLDINFSHTFLNDEEVYWVVTVMDDKSNGYASYEITGKTDTYDFPTLGLPAGTYYVRVSYYVYFTVHYWSSAQYSLTATFTNTSQWEKERNETFDTATSLPINGFCNGSIRYSGDTDYYKIVLNSNGVLDVNFTHEILNSTTNLWNISILDAKCNTLVSKTITGKIDDYNFPSLGLSSGTYYVKVNGNSSWSWIPYKITTNFKQTSYWEQESTTGDITDIKLYYAYYGTVSSTSDVDWYRLTIYEDGQLDIRFDIFSELTSTSRYYTVTILDSKYNKLKEQAIYLNSKSTTVAVTGVKPGVHYITVTDSSYLCVDKYSITATINHNCSGSWRVIYEAGCIVYGRKECRCYKCNALMYSEYINPHGHIYSDYISESDSKHSISCSVCDYEQTTNHVWDAGIITTDPTCTTTGIKTYTCTYCLHTVEKTVSTFSEHVINEWKTADDATHKSQCDCGELTYAPHTFIEEIDVSPQCEAEGVMKLVCSDCGYTKTESIAETGHSFNDWITDVPSTCTETGTERRDCINCDHYETRSVSSLGHNYMKDWTVDVEPTCEMVGSKSRHCTRCDDKIDVIEIVTTKHYLNSWSYDEQYYKRATCTEEGLQYRKCQNCTFVEERTIAPYGHYYSTKEVYVAPTCTEDGKRYYPCQRCGDTESNVKIIPATGHFFTTWNNSKNPTCTESGTEGSHCNACGEYTERAVSAFGHVYYSEWTIDVYATCQNDGSKSHHCYVCGDRSDITIIKSEGHNFDAWQTVVEPTASKEGSQTRRCKDCNYSETATIAKSQGLTGGAVAAISVSSTATASAGIATGLWYLWKKKLLFFK